MARTGLGARGTGREFTPVIVESPYAGDAGQLDRVVEKHLAYLRACLRDCLLRGEAPFASHGLYTQPGVLDDSIPEERQHGIQAGFAWRPWALRTVVYTDLGLSKGMEAGIAHARRLHQPVVFRTLGAPWAL